MNHWKKLLIKLTEVDDCIFARWHLINDAKPYMILPAKDKLGSKNIETDYPLSYDHIKEIEIVKEFRHGAKIEFRNDLDKIETFLKKTKEFKIIRDNGAIHITPAEVADEIAASVV